MIQWWCPRRGTEDNVEVRWSGSVHKWNGVDISDYDKKSLIISLIELMDQYPDEHIWFNMTGNTMVVAQRMDSQNFDVFVAKIERFGHLLRDENGN